MWWKNTLKGCVSRGDLRAELEPTVRVNVAEEKV